MYVFSGIGLSIIKSNARRLTRNMRHAACKSLLNYTSLKDSSSVSSFKMLLPPITEINRISKKITSSVATQAVKDGVSLKKS